MLSYQSVTCSFKSEMENGLMKYLLELFCCTLFNDEFSDLILIWLYLLGDKILEVNGEALDGLTHHEAIARFKRVKSGIIDMVVRSQTPSPFPR